MAKEEEAMSGKSFLQFIGGDGDDDDDDGDVTGIEVMPGKLHSTVVCHMFNVHYCKIHDTIVYLYYWYHCKCLGDTSNMGFCGFFLLWLSWYFCHFEDFLHLIILKIFVRLIILKTMIRMNQSESLGVCSSSPFPSPYLFVSRWSQFDNFKSKNLHHLIVGGVRVSMWFWNSKSRCIYI